MTRDDVIRMAYKVSDGVLSYDAEGRWVLSEQEVIQLAALAVAAEREACAEFAEEEANNPVLTLMEQYRAKFIADAIRARGEK
jgi:hypothetical protein